MRRFLTGAASGVIASGFGVTVAELLAAVTRPEAGPLIAVGGAVIDATPTPIKEFAVRELGTNDKPALLTGIVVILALFTAAVGVVGMRHRIAVPIGAFVFGAAGVYAALSRPTATAFYDVVPSVLGAAIAGAHHDGSCSAGAGPRLSRPAPLGAAVPQGFRSSSVLSAGGDARGLRRRDPRRRRAPPDS